MSYTPKEWVCGETITADALNHIEQGIANSGGGYSCTSQVLYEGSVTTTQGEGYATGEIDNLELSAPVITVTVGGTEYTLYGVACYGGWYRYNVDCDTGLPDFTDAPIAFRYVEGYQYVYTENAGTYSIKIETEGETDISACFERAAAKASTMFVHFTYDEDTDTTTADKSVAEIVAAFRAGKNVVGVMVDDFDSSCYHVTKISSTYINFVYADVYELGGVMRLYVSIYTLFNGGTVVNYDITLQSTE